MKIRSQQTVIIRYAVLFSATLLLMVFSGSVQAQKKQRIGLSEGANSVEVKGKITGKQYVLYEIWVEKGDKWEVDLDSANSFIGYTVKGPDGDRYDFLEEPQMSGYYTIRVDLNSAGSKSKKTAAFTLKVKFDMKPGAPIGD